MVLKARRAISKSQPFAPETAITGTGDRQVIKRQMSGPEQHSEVMFYTAPDARTASVIEVIILDKCLLLLF
jgi:hypothetical protein